MTPHPPLLLAAALWLYILLVIGVVPRSEAVPTEETIVNDIHHGRPAPIHPSPQDSAMKNCMNQCTTSSATMISIPTSWSLSKPRTMPPLIILQSQGGEGEGEEEEWEQKTEHREEYHVGHVVIQKSSSLPKNPEGKGDDPCPPPPPPQGNSATAHSRCWSSLHRKQIHSNLLLLKKRAASPVPATSTAPPPPRPLRVLPANHPPLVQPLLLSSTTASPKTLTRSHPTARTRRPKSKQADPKAHVAAAANVPPPSPHKGLYHHSKNSNSNSNNSTADSLTGQVNGTDPQSEEGRLMREEQEADRASPKMILIALGASIGGLSACFCCLLGFGRILGCCYWKRLGLAKRRSSLPLPTTLSSTRLTDLPRDRKWIIGGPKPMKEDEGEEGNQFSTAVHGGRGRVGEGAAVAVAVGGYLQGEGPLSASLSTASTLVSQERQGREKEGKELPRFTQFWRDPSPDRSSFSMLKPWKKNPQSPQKQGFHPQIEIPSRAMGGSGGCGGGSAMQITSPIESIPPRRPLAPSEQEALPMVNLSCLISSPTTPMGRSRRMPAHSPTPRSFKQQIQTQGRADNLNCNDHDRSNESGGSHGGEDDNVDDDDGVEWLMMTSPPREQQQWDDDHFSSDAFVHDFNNGWGNQFVEGTEDGETAEGYFASTHARPHPHAYPTLPPQRRYQY